MKIIKTFNQHEVIQKEEVDWLTKRLIGKRLIFKEGIDLNFLMHGKDFKNHHTDVFDAILRAIIYLDGRNKR